MAEEKKGEVKSKAKKGNALLTLHVVLVVVVGIYFVFASLSYVFGSALFSLTGWEAFRASDATAARAGASGIVFAAGILISIAVRFLGPQRIAVSRWLLIVFGVYNGFYILRWVLNLVVTANALVAVVPERVDSLGSYGVSGVITMYRVNFAAKDIVASNIDIPFNPAGYSVLEDCLNGADGWGLDVNEVPPQRNVPRIYEISSLRSTTLAGALNPFSTSDYGVVVNEAVNTFVEDPPMGFFSQYRARNYANKPLDTQSIPEREATLRQITADLESEANYGLGFLGKLFGYAGIIIILFILPFVVTKFSTKKISADANGVFVFNKPLWAEMFDLIYSFAIGGALLYTLYGSYMSSETTWIELSAYTLMNGVFGIYYLVRGYSAISNSNDEMHIGPSSIRIKDNNLASKDVTYDRVDSVVVDPDKHIVTINGAVHELDNMNLKAFAPQITNALQKYYNATIIEKKSSTSTSDATNEKPAAETTNKTT